MKRTLKQIIAIALVVFIIGSQVFMSIAATLDIKATTKRIGSIPVNNESDDMVGMQGMCVTAVGSNNRLFVARIDESKNIVKLYMYKDYTTMSNSSNDGYGVFTLEGLGGHANGMAVDDNYIYITSWNKSKDTNKNKILQISRRKLWSMYKATNETEKGTIKAGDDGYTILSSYYSNGSVYEDLIYSITYYKDGKFIINYYPKNSELFYTSSTKTIYYTTAEVQNGKFVVSNSPSDVFCVDTGTIKPTGQDIGYGAKSGFFIVLWLGGAKNKIVWIRLNSLSGNNRAYTATNSKYRHINLNMSEKVFSQYELESVSIGSDYSLYGNVNTTLAKNADPKYDVFDSDGIIRIERSVPVNNSTKFLGNNIDY